MNPLSMLTALAVFAAAGLGSANASEPYPSRPITIVVPYPAGGSDIQVRKIQTALSESLGQPVIVENKPGASGAIAAVSVARAKPDGYPLLHANNGLLITPIVNKRAGYNLLKDFKPVSTLTTSPMVLLVKSDFPAKNLADFLHYAREQPNGLRYASSGTASLTRIETARLGDAARIKLQHIPYKGQSNGALALRTGEVDILLTPPSADMLSLVEQGTLRALGIASASPGHPIAPSIPTIQSAVPGYVSEAWFGLLAPAGTPDEVIAKLNAALRKVMTDPQVRSGILISGVVAQTSTPGEFQALMSRDAAQLSEAVAKYRIDTE